MKVFLFLGFLLVVGFSAVDLIDKENKPEEPEEEISVNDTVTVNTAVLEFIPKGTMVASWYGPRFHGKKTANGEIFDQEALTAAHKKLRFGTLLRLVNPDNGNSVIVRINDRGPFIYGRHIDLSRAAAEELGMIHRGVKKLEVELVTLRGANFPVISFN